MNLFPILDYNAARHGNRHENGQWNGYRDGDAQCQQGNRNQRFPKSKSRTDQSRQENDGDDMDCGVDDDLLVGGFREPEQTFSNLPL